MQTCLHALRVVAAVLLLCTWSGAARCEPEVGWWWNPAESGRGFFIESQGGIIYLAGYFYGADGRAAWMVAGGPNADPYSFDGRLQSYSGGQTLFGAYRPPSGSPVDGGPISLRFSDDTHATLTWPGGAVALQRHVFGADDPAFQPLPGWWWNPDESGRGYSIELQGDKLFVASFMYEDDGRPVWYISAGSMTTPMHYEGPWLRYSNGQTMTGPYHAPDAPQTVGTLSVDFIQADTATLTFAPTTGASLPELAPKAISPLAIPIRREFLPTFDLAPRYDVRFTYKAVLDARTTSGFYLSYTINGVVTFERLDDELAPLPSPSVPHLNPPGYLYVAKLDPEAKPISIDYHNIYGTSLNCETFGQMTAAIPSSGGVFALEISEHGPYTGKIVVPKIKLPVKGTCKAPGVGEFPVSEVDDGLLVSIRMDGSIVSPRGFGYQPIGVGARHDWTWVLQR